MHFRRAGDSGPWLVLLHQTTDTSRMWEAVLPRLGDHCRAVAFDTPGYGESEGPEALPRPREYARAFLQACDGLGIDRFALGGFHAGAGLALYVYDVAPDRIERLLLCGIPRFDDAWRADRLSRANPGPVPQADGSHLLNAWKANSNPNLAVRSREILDMLRNGEGTFWAADSIFQESLDPILAKVTVPVLSIIGTKDFLYQSMPTTVTLLGDARLEILEGEVLVMDSQPDEFARLAAAFARGETGG
jgi:pimeloyl-ACP methyl ester carboxylesterase